MTSAQLIILQNNLIRFLTLPAFLPPQYERSMLLEPETGNEFELRTWTRNNITETLNSLNVNTVDDIQQISAALAQCTVCSPSPPPASGSSRCSLDALQFLFFFPVSLSPPHIPHGEDKYHLLTSLGFLW